MMKKFLFSFVFVTVFFSWFACQKVDRIVLDIENSVFVKADISGNLIPVDSIKPTYYPGDSIVLALLNTGQFEKDKKGFASISMKLIIKDSLANPVYEKMLIEPGEGLINLTGNTIGTTYAVWKSPYDVPAGKYFFIVEVRDELNGQFSTLSRDFYIK